MNDRFDREVDLRRLPYRDVEQEAHNALRIKEGGALRVYVDDGRMPAHAPETWVVVRSAFEAVRLLRDHPVRELSLDHDLGVEALRGQGFPEDVLELVGSGYDVVHWLEARLLGDGIDRVPGVLNIHSGNVVGAKRMLDAIASISRRVPLRQTDLDRRTWSRTDR